MKFFKLAGCKDKKKRPKVEVSRGEHLSTSPRGREIQQKFFPKYDRMTAVVQSGTVRVNGTPHRALHRMAGQQK